MARSYIGRPGLRPRHGGSGASCDFRTAAPTAAHVARLLLDGEGDPEVMRGLLEGFPPAAVAVFELPGDWSELTEAGARLTRFHVGHG